VLPREVRPINHDLDVVTRHTLSQCDARCVTLAALRRGAGRGPASAGTAAGAFEPALGPLMLLVISVAGLLAVPCYYR
jgi:hypothetical protein